MKFMKERSWQSDTELDEFDIAEKEEDEAEIRAFQALCEKYCHPADEKNIGLLIGIKASESVWALMRAREQDNKRGRAKFDESDHEEDEREFTKRQANAMTAVEELLKSSPRQGSGWQGSSFRQGGEEQSAEFN
jgi:hypothetical protein